MPRVKEKNKAIINGYFIELELKYYQMIFINFKIIKSIHLNNPTSRKLVFNQKNIPTCKFDL
jgi:hypothetical protein